jgi:hypothetical protein
MAATLARAIRVFDHDRSVSWGRNALSPAATARQVLAIRRAGRPGTVRPAPLPRSKPTPRSSRPLGSCSPRVILSAPRWGRLRARRGRLRQLSLKSGRRTRDTGASLKSRTRSEWIAAATSSTVEPVGNANGSPPSRTLTRISPRQAPGLRFQTRQTGIVQNRGCHHRQSRKRFAEPIHCLCVGIVGFRQCEHRRCLDAVLAQLRAEGYPVRDEDVARLSPARVATRELPRPLRLHQQPTGSATAPARSQRSRRRGHLTGVSEGILPRDDH